MKASDILENLIEEAREECYERTGSFSPPDDKEPTPCEGVGPKECSIEDEYMGNLSQIEDYCNSSCINRQIEPQLYSTRKGKIVRGVMSFPTEAPPESILLGDEWLRRGDVATLISSAGAGKSVATNQAAMAWGLGLPALGIKPSRPLRCLLFSGEDDETTIGEQREGFLANSLSTAGKELEAEDLGALDSMLRIDFSREHAGEEFHIHLSSLLQEEPADLVLINPLFSYIGGDIVANAHTWIRRGLVPILQQFNCGALITSHTNKLNRGDWDNLDDTYSANGGGEMANAPRSVITLRPTPHPELSVLKVAKRKTTGWLDSSGARSDACFVKRSQNPHRPAWIPVNADEAAGMLAGIKSKIATAKRKCSPQDVVNEVASAPLQQPNLIKHLEAKCQCSDKTAKAAIRDAIESGAVASYDRANPNGGHPYKWICLPDQIEQGED